VTRLQLIAPSASPEEAAAVVAALERFIRDTAPSAPRPAPTVEPWRRAALLEAVERAAPDDARDPWINT
jgi:hypothetical protein